MIIKGRREDNNVVETQTEKTDNWEIESFSWDPKGRRWEKQPVLIVNGEKFKFNTPHGYIETLNKKCLPDKHFTELTDKMEDLIGMYQINHPLKKNVFTYIAMGLIIFFFADATFLWSEAALSVNADEKIIPGSFWLSSYFWFLAFIGTVYAVLTNKFDSYKIMEKGNDGKWTESMDMTDQMSGAFMELLSPVAKGMGYAMIPYYITYLLVNFIAGIRTYLLVIFIVLAFFIAMWLFITTRPIDTRKREVFWALKWFSIYIAINIFSFYMID